MRFKIQKQILSGTYCAVSITSCGGFAPSRLIRLKAVLFVVVSAILKVPLPVISGVMSTLVHTPEAKEPDVPLTVPTAGALEKLMLVSLQELSVTPRTS